MEEFSSNGWIDLYYADESRVSLEANVPYGWQFLDEEVYMPVEKGGGLNLFGMIGRNNKLIYETTTNKIDASFIFEQLETFSGGMKKPTVVVLDNATVHPGENNQRAVSGVAEQRIVYLLFADLFATFEHRRNFMAKDKIRMAFAVRLCR